VWKELSFEQNRVTPLTLISILWFIVNYSM
jgi:hypothetical protein